MLGRSATAKMLAKKIYSLGVGFKYVWKLVCCNSALS